MTKLKLTVLPVILFAFILVFNSCTKDGVAAKKDVYTNSGIPKNTTAVVPTALNANSSTAAGTLDVTYRRDSKQLTYTIKWNNLSGPPAAGASGVFTGLSFPAIGIYGLASRGYVAIPSPPLANYPGGIIQSINAPSGATTTGTVTGTLFIDGTVITESDLLAGKLYVMVRTAARPWGELRGQVELY